MTLNKIYHVGIVVKNMEEGRKRFSDLLGIKKWYELQYSSPLELYYEGEKRNCKVKLCLGGSGTTVIELIETSGDRNIYTDFLEKNGEGLHHIMYNVKDLDECIKDFEKNGLKVLQYANFESAGSKVRYAYMGTGKDSVVFELVENTVGGKLKKGDMPFELVLGSLAGNYKKIKSK